MITKIHKQFTASKIQSAIIVLLVMALAGVFSIPSMLKRAGSGGPWALRINGKEISYQDFSRESAEQQENLNRFRAQYGQFADLILQAQGINGDPQALARDILIKQELLVQLAQSMNVAIDHEYIQQKLNDKAFVAAQLADIVPSFIFERDGAINQNSLRFYLKQQGLTARAFEERVLKGLYRAILFSCIQGSLYVPAYEVEHRIRMTTAQKKFSILSFLRDDYVKKEMEKAVSQEEVRAYYDAKNAQEKKYWVPEKRFGTTWTFSSKTYDIVISNDAIQAYYEDNKTKSYVDQPAKVEIRYILVDSLDLITQKREALIENPHLFAAVAQEISLDDSAKNGGLWEAFARGEKDPVVERAAFILQKDTDISDVLEVKDGYALVQRVSKKPRTYKSFDVVKESIKEILVQNEFKELFAQEIKELLSLESDEDRAEKVANFVRKRRGVDSKIEAVATDSTPAGKALFKLSGKELTFYAEKNKGVLVQLNRIEPSLLPELSTIKEVVTADLYEDRAATKMLSDAIEFKKKMHSEPLKDLLAAYSVTQEKTDWISTKQDKKGVLFDSYGISESEIKNLELVHSAYLHQGDTSVVIVRLDEIETKTPQGEKEGSVEYARIANDVEREYNRLTIEGLVASLYRNATIETNKEVTFQIEDLLYE